MWANAYHEGNMYIKTMRRRTKTTSNRVSTSRDRGSIETCRRCGLADETLSYVLQSCPWPQGIPSVFRTGYAVTRSTNEHLSAYPDCATRWQGSCSGCNVCIRVWARMPSEGVPPEGRPLQTLGGNRKAEIHRPWGHFSRIMHRK